MQYIMMIGSMVLGFGVGFEPNQPTKNVEGKKNARKPRINSTDISHLKTECSRKLLILYG